MNTPIVIFPGKKEIFTANELVTTLKILLSPLPNSMCGDLISPFFLTIVEVAKQILGFTM